MRVDELAKSRKIPTRNIFPLLFRAGFTCGAVGNEEFIMVEGDATCTEQVGSLVGAAVASRCRRRVRTGHALERHCTGGARVELGEPLPPSCAEQARLPNKSCTRATLHEWGKSRA